MLQCCRSEREKTNTKQVDLGSTCRGPITLLIDLHVDVCSLTEVKGNNRNRLAIMLIMNMNAFFFSLLHTSLMDHLIEMEITHKNAANGGGTVQSSKMPPTYNDLPTKKNGGKK